MNKAPVVADIARNIHFHAPTFEGQWLATRFNAPRHDASKSLWNGRICFIRGEGERECRSEKDKMTEEFHSFGSELLIPMAGKMSSRRIGTKTVLTAGEDDVINKSVSATRREC